jgi:hypothetical protein
MKITGWKKDEQKNHYNYLYHYRTVPQQINEYGLPK